MIIFIHQHSVVGNETKIHKTVTRLWHITDTHDLNYIEYSNRLTYSVEIQVCLQISEIYRRLLHLVT